MGEQDLTPQRPPPRCESFAPSRSAEWEAGRRFLSPDALAYLDVVLPRLSAEGYKTCWDEFDCVADLSRFEWTKFGFVDYTFVFVEFDELDAGSLWDFSRTAFNYAAARRGMSMPGLQGAKFCLSVALVHRDEGAVDAVRNVVAPKHFAKLEFPCVVDLPAGELHYLQQTPLWGAAYYAGLRGLAERMLGPWC